MKENSKTEDDFQKDINKYIKKEYYREWRKNNKDKIKKYNEKFWKKQAEKMNNKEQ